VQEEAVRIAAANQDRLETGRRAIRRGVDCGAGFTTGAGAAIVGASSRTARAAARSTAAATAPAAAPTVGRPLARFGATDTHNPDQNDKQRNAWPIIHGPIVDRRPRRGVNIIEI